MKLPLPRWKKPWGLLPSACLATVGKEVASAAVVVTPSRVWCFPPTGS